jgi:hypothetical protein
MQGDSIDPRSQGRFAMKLPHSSEDLHEDILRKVGCIGAVVNGARQ